MNIFSRVRIAPKILAVIGLMGGVAITVTGVSFVSLQALSAATDEIDLTAREIRLSGIMNRLIVGLNRDEYRLAADPDAHRDVAGEVAEARAAARQALAEALGTAGPRQKELLADVAARFDAYAAELDDTLKLAGAAVGQVEIGERQREILASVRSSDAAAQRLVESVRGYASFTEEKGTRVSQEASATADSRITLLIVVATTGIVAGLALGWLVAMYGIVSPVRRIVACLRSLADGDLATEVVGVGRRDEVGEIAGAAEVFKRNLVRNREMEQEAKATEIRNAEERRAAMLKLADGFEQNVGVVVQSVGSSAAELQATATQLSATVEELNAQSTAVAAASEQASANVHTVAAASEEMTAAIRDLSQRVAGSAGRSKEIAEGAEGVQRELDQLLQAIGQVDSVLSAIGDVASQTNLLALNATIEAARAGEAGKGFAVVASEVKNLATQTQRMTDEVATQIGAVKTVSARTVGAVRGIIAQVDEIDRSTSEMAAAVEQQSMATGEISRNSQQAAIGTSEVSANVTGINQASRDTGEASVAMRGASDDLARQSATLKHEMDRFLAQVRAA